MSNNIRCERAYDYSGVKRNLTISHMAITMSKKPWHNAEVGRLSICMHLRTVIMVIIVPIYEISREEQT